MSPVDEVEDDDAGNGMQMINQILFHTYVYPNVKKDINGIMVNQPNYFYCCLKSRQVYSYLIRYSLLITLLGKTIS